MKSLQARIALVLRLRRLRVRQAEQLARVRRAELGEGLAELDGARDIEAGWARAERELAGWLEGVGPALRVRWTDVADARRAEIAGALRESRDYVAWWQDEVRRLQEAEAQARAALRREQARCDALERRHGAESRRAASREEERAFQELADAAGASYGRRTG